MLSETSGLALFRYCLFFFHAEILWIAFFFLPLQHQIKKTIMADDTRERYINPYTDFGFKKLFEQAEIARYSETERRQYEESKKVFWDNYSVLKTAEMKGVLKEKTETVRRLQAMGLTVEQIAQGAAMSIDEVRKLLQ
jgi:predicted transposase/invertase (TIGR01784 family)